jgi:hypothetical protein
MVRIKILPVFEIDPELLEEYNKPRTGKKKKRWSIKYKKNINCSDPKGFSQRNYCNRKRRGGKYKSEG